MLDTILTQLGSSVVAVAAFSILWVKLKALDQRVDEISENVRNIYHHLIGDGDGG